jgi:hypothetical protein
MGISGFPRSGRFPRQVYIPLAATAVVFRDCRLTNADDSPASDLVPAVSYVDGSFAFLINAYNPDSGHTANQITLWKIDAKEPALPNSTTGQ